MAIIRKDNLDYPRIKIRHVPTGEQVEFLPYITDFSDNFASKWDPTEAFGRMDEIKTFSRTTRTISLTFNIISENLEEAKENYQNTSLLMSFLYPTYRTTEINSQQVNSPDPGKISDATRRAFELTSGIAESQPQNANVDSFRNDMLEKVSQINEALILSSQQEAASNIANASFREASLMNAPPILQIDFSNLIKQESEDGLYGTVEGLIYKPDTDAGYFIERGSMYAKVVEVSFSFTVIHTKPIGWKYDNRDNRYKLRNRNFPFYKK